MSDTKKKKKKSFEGDEMSASYMDAFTGLKSALLSTKPMLEASGESILSGNTTTEEAENAAHAVSMLFVRFVSKFMNWICGLNAQQEDIEVMNMLLLVTVRMIESCFSSFSSFFFCYL